MTPSLFFNPEAMKSLLIFVGVMCAALAIGWTLLTGLIKLMFGKAGLVMFYVVIAFALMAATSFSLDNQGGLLNTISSQTGLGSISSQINQINQMNQMLNVEANLNN